MIFTKIMALQEELKLYPLGDVWNYICKITQVPEGLEWFKEIKKYEHEVLVNRK